MAQIVFDIPDDKIPRILDAFADVFGFVPGQGTTKAQFAKHKIRDYIREIVVRSELAEANKQTAKNIQDSANLLEIL